ncbi:MAG: M42 family metallopeptidase [Promethearchaeota archaeon]
MEKNELEILKELTESFGPPGFERETASIVKKYVEEFADEILTDKLGSVMFKINGSAEKPVILIPGHIDEIGFVISGIDQTGFLTFNTLGGFFDQVLLAQRVIVRTRDRLGVIRDRLGVITSIPPHVLPREERKKVITKEKMYIDVGCSSKEEAEEEGFRIGDPVVPVSPFSMIRDGKLAVGKAFDDRLGIFAAMIALKRLKEQGIEHPNTVLGAATTQEEVGLRGARTTAYLVDPDVAFVLEIDISSDVPGVENSRAPSKMGEGIAILTHDGSMIPNQPLKEFVINVAEEANIKYQLSAMPRGGTDAGAIHISRVGVPSIVLGIPTRHIHSHVSMTSIEDIERMINLLIELIKRTDKETVTSFTSI